MRHDITYMLDKYNISENYDFPRLVSFPRTGSHWFRYVMEVAIEQPAIVSSYYYPNPDKCWGLHIHDRWLDNKDVPPTRNLKNVIYLFRDGIDTVYSMLRYDKTIPDNWDGTRSETIDYEVQAATLQYKEHLERWRFKRDDIERCLEVRYENLMKHPKQVFQEVFNFLGLEVSDEKLEYAINDATKEKIDSLIVDRHAMDKFSAYHPSHHKNMKDRFSFFYGTFITTQLEALLK
jgi:hypothetical protein